MPCCCCGICTLCTVGTLSQKYTEPLTVVVAKWLLPNGSFQMVVKKWLLPGGSCQRVVARRLIPGGCCQVVADFQFYFKEVFRKGPFHNYLKLYLNFRICLLALFVLLSFSYRYFFGRLKGVIFM